MAEQLSTDIVVIGAGSGGLSVAAGASQLGASVILLEGGQMGGDCLNTGCVPSKALLRAAKAAAELRAAGRFGVRAAEPEIDVPAVTGHVRKVIEAIEPNDSIARFEGLGVRVISEYGRFTGRQSVAAGPYEITAKRIVIATGSRAAIPPIPGIEDVDYLTTETIFEQMERPEHLIIIGAGPIGIEMGQAHRRLGSEVTILDLGPMLPKDDPELVDVVRQRLLGEGVSIRERVRIDRVERHGRGVIVVISDQDGEEQQIMGSHLLVAAGRKPNTGMLNLEAAGIAYDRKGITVDDRLRTSNPKIMAIGDVAGGPQFTHVAGYHAGLVIKNLLFWIPAKTDYRALPWVTSTEPELAHVGMSEAQARERFGQGGFQIARWSFHENDRAQAEGKTGGMVKVILRKGRVVGASIVGPQAGELIQLWCLAVQQKMKLTTIAGMMAPYPTLGEISKRAAGAYFMPRLFNDKTRRMVRILLKFI